MTQHSVGKEAGIHLLYVVFLGSVLLPSLGGTAGQGRVVRCGRWRSEFSADSFTQPWAD